MKKYLTLLLILIIVNQASFAQSNYEDFDSGTRSTWMDKVYVGGGLGGLGFSSKQFWINVNGMVGYRWTQKLNTGVGISYQYLNVKAPASRDFHDYGFNIFTQYTIYEPLFLMAQYEVFFIDQVERRRAVDALLFGAGISQPMGGKGFANVYALYNVLHDADEFGRYASPWVIGVNFGIGF